MPGLKLSNHVCAGHQIKVAANRGLRKSERSRRFGSVPYLAVVVRKHDPKAVELRTRNPHTELRQVLFEKGTDELLSPCEAA